MSSERIFRAIGDVGDDLIARADRPAQRRPAWLRWGALAACCALAVGLAALALPRMGFGANSASPHAAGVAAQDTAQAESAKATSEEPAEEPAEAPDAASWEFAADAPEEQPQEPAAQQEPAEEGSFELPTSDMAPADAEQAQPLLARSCAKMVLRYGAGEVAVTQSGEVDEIMQALRALPVTGEDADVEEQPLQLYLYESDAGQYYALVELPRMRVLGADEAGAGGKAAQDAPSAEAAALYEALIETYFAE